MEVFHMNKQIMYEVIKAIEACQKKYGEYYANSSDQRSGNRRWDYIIQTVCVGCEKPLGRYENLNRLAYCKSCREILFPETVDFEERHSQRSPYRKFRGISYKRPASWHGTEWKYRGRLSYSRPYYF